MKKVEPESTSRAEAFKLWMDAPNPMVTFFKNIDVTPLVKSSRRRKLKFNMLLCHCIVFNNPFIIWGKYKKRLFKYTLPISFQFHHTQMDGAHAGRFLENLQDEINKMK